MCADREFAGKSPRFGCIPVAKVLRVEGASTSEPDELTPIDDVDRDILQLLQRDARNTTAVEMGEAVGVSDATVRNRIGALEDRGIVEGSVPTTPTNGPAIHSDSRSDVRPVSVCGKNRRRGRSQSRAWWR